VRASNCPNSPRRGSLGPRRIGIGVSAWYQGEESEGDDVTERIYQTVRCFREQGETVIPTNRYAYPRGE
jgi:hypothetical protein